jgi:valyl-tRNA synthetase
MKFNLEEENLIVEQDQDVFDENFSNSLLPFLSFPENVLKNYYSNFLIGLNLFFYFCYYLFLFLVTIYFCSNFIFLFIFVLILYFFIYFLFIFVYFLIFIF